MQPQGERVARILRYPDGIVAAVQSVQRDAVVVQSIKDKTEYKFRAGIVRSARLPLKAGDIVSAKLDQSMACLDECVSRPLKDWEVYLKKLLAGDLSDEGLKDLLSCETPLRELCYLPCLRDSGRLFCGTLTLLAKFAASNATRARKFASKMIAAPLLSMPRKHMVGQ